MSEPGRDVLLHQTEGRDCEVLVIALVVVPDDLLKTIFLVIRAGVVIDVGVKERRDLQFRKLFLHQAVVLNRLIDARSGKQRVELAVVTQNRPVLADILNHHHLMRLAPVLIGGEIVFYPLLELP